MAYSNPDPEASQKEIGLEQLRSLALRELWRNISCWFRLFFPRLLVISQPRSSYLNMVDPTGQNS
jgi:hypothetical protein